MGITKIDKPAPVINRSKKPGRPPSQKTRIKRLQDKARNLMQEQFNEDTPPADIGELIELIYEMSLELSHLAPPERKG